MLDHEIVATPLGPDDVEPHIQAACMEAAAACALACLGCADGCVMEREPGAFRRCIQLDLDCADICTCTARILARGNDFDPRIWRAQLEACARACAACSAECLRHERHAHCRLAAEACLRCEERCRALLGELPEVPGATSSTQEH